jgi:MFS family permease
VSKPLSILKQRNFRLLFIGQSVSVLGDGMVNVALAFAVLSVTNSPSAVGLVFAARTLPLVACLLIGGVLADRTSPRAVMIGADLVRLAAQGAMAALLIAGAAEVWSLALLAALGGAAAGFFNPASSGVMPLVVDADRLQQANGLRASSKSAGEIAGPVLAGVLVATAGPGWALAVDAATFAVSAALLVPLTLRARPALAEATFLADLRHGWREFRTRRWVWTLVFAVTFGNVMWAAWSALGPVIAERDLGGADVWGVVLAALGVGGFCGGLVALKVRPHRPLVVATVAFAVMSVPIAVLASGAPAGVLAAGAFLGGVGLTLGNTTWESTIQRHIPAESLSRVTAYDWFGSLAFAPLGYALWGPVAAAIGITTALWIACAAQAVVLLALLLVPDIRKLREPVPA